MEKDNNNLYALSDKAILDVLGNFIRDCRLQQNNSQQTVADAAGINRSTLSQVENGGGGTILSFIQILRALQQLDILRHFQIQQKISPMQLAIQQKKAYRERARTSKSAKQQSQSDW